MRLWGVSKEGRIIGYVLGDANAKTLKTAMGDTFHFFVSKQPVPKKWNKRWIPVWKDQRLHGKAQWGAFESGWNTWVMWQLQDRYGYLAAKTDEGAFSRVSGAHPLIVGSCHPVYFSGEEKDELKQGPGFVPIFPGWNVWSVWQSDDLDFDIGLVGFSREYRLRWFVEESVRLGTVGPEVADPLDLKGGQIQILHGDPGLKAIANKDQVPGESALIIDGPAKKFYVRFYNRGTPGSIVWPHTNNYVVDEVFQPDPNNVATSGPPPPTVLDPLKQSVLKPIGTTVAWAAVIGIGALIVVNKVKS